MEDVDTDRGGGIGNPKRSQHHGAVPDVVVVNRAGDDHREMAVFAADVQPLE
jgi:hypothetical protein